MVTAYTNVSFPELGLDFTLKKLLIDDFLGMKVAWYGVIICFAMICACAVILFNAVKREGFVLDSFLDYFLFAIPLGVVGARLMYVLSMLENYDSIMDAIAIWEGGLAIYGGVIAGAVTVWVVSRIKKHPTLQVFDAIIPGLFLAQSIGRWGNFVNGEAFGERVSKDFLFGMVVNGHGPVHPTFLYEAVITLLGFVISMFLLYRFKKFHGEIFCFYLIWYGIGRTLVEGLRTDSLMIGSLRLAQCIGIASALAGICLTVILILNQQNRALAEAENTAEDLVKGAESEESVAEDDVKEEKNALPEEAEEEKEDGSDH